ncbi:MAG: leucine-rich repeat domain-containing protein [Clostridia bacterium]|nr:leucine-rich repeat domain-containing protein [Clostridia bacterium]
MKKFRLFIFISLIVCLFLAVTGCAPALSCPTNVKIDSDTLILSWNKVEEAEYYTISINGEENDSSKNSYALERLSEGTYQVKVKACGDGHRDSVWTETIEFKREAEPGMVFKLINNNTEYELSNIGTAVGDIVVPDEYRGKPVTSIGKKAFAQKPKLTSITLGPNIRTIGEQAFYKCLYLKTANIPAGVTSIGKKAFQSCSVLESDIVIPEGVTEIAEGTFGYCRALKNVKIGSNVKKIDLSAFTDCDNLSKIEIPDSVETIGEYAFSACVSATELILGDGVKSIGKNAFYQCTALTKIELSENVETIGEYAFANCSEVTEVTMEDKVTSIGIGAFMDCVKLATFDLSDGLQTIGYDSILRTAIWTAADNIVYLDEDWLVDCKIKDAATYQVKDGTIGIGSGAFIGCNTFTQMFLPDSVEIIDSLAFAGCANLNAVVTGSSVERIGSQAFYYCTKLQTVKLGHWDFEEEALTASSLKTIENHAFYKCELLKEIEIPDTVEKIGSYAFRKSGIYTASGNGLVYADNWLVDWNGDIMLFFKMFGGSTDYVVEEGTVGVAEYALYRCQDIVGITFPESTTKIGRAAFYEASKLQKVVLPSTLKRIEEYTFYSCPYLFDIEIPEGVEFIGRSAFYQSSFLGCTTELREDGYYYVADREATFVIPDSVEVIEDYAFYRCGYMVPDAETGEEIPYGVDHMVIGDGVKSIGLNAFNKFVSLKTLTIGDGMETIGQKAFYRCSSLETVDLGSSVQTIGIRAFYECKNLKSVTIPGSVVDFGKYAFYNCEALEDLTLSEGLTTISDYAFSGCKSLKKVTLPSSLTSIGKFAFRNCALSSIVIPEEIVSISNHAFYRCNELTVYAEASSVPETWGNRWNSSYCAAVWGVNLSSEGYVVSLEKTADTLTNVNEMTEFNAPERDGYVFAGWLTVENGTADDVLVGEIAEVADGTMLYAYWVPEQASAQ